MEKTISYSLTTFNHDGRLIQIDNALKAISYSNTMVALKSKSCAILISKNKLSFSISANDNYHISRIFLINNKIGIGGSGLYPDLKLLVKRARRQAKLFQSNFGEEISSRQLTKEISSFIQEFTQAGGVRVFGVSLFVMGFDSDGPNLYQIDPSGLFFKIKGGAIGKNSNMAIEILRKRLSDTLKLNDICNIGLAAFQETSEVPISNYNIHLASISENCIFKIYNSSEIQKFIENKIVC